MFNSQDGSNVTVAEEGKFERLIEPFEIREGQEIEVGDYAFNEFSISYSSDRSKAISGNARASRGGFFDGDRDAYSLGVRLQPNYRLRVEGSWSHNDIMLPTGDFSTELLRSRVFYSFNTRMFLNRLIQYNSAVQEIVTNIRFNFIYKPLSDFFWSTMNAGVPLAKPFGVRAAFPSKGGYCRANTIDRGIRQHLRWNRG